MELRLATFNLENLGIRPNEESHPLRERLPRHVESLRGTLQRLEADAVAVQEVIDPSLFEELAEGLGYPHAVLSERASSPLLLGVMSRYPLTSPQQAAASTHFSVSDPKTGFEIAVKGAFSRGVLHLQWDVPSFGVDLYVVHWKSKIPTRLGGGAVDGEGGWTSHGQVGEGRLLTEIKRVAQAVELRKEIDLRLRGSEESRLVVLGDFNDSLDSEALRIVRGDSKACGSPTLAPEELFPCELSVPEDLRFTQIYRGRREMLDHVLVSRNLIPHLVATTILNEDVAEAAEGPSVDPYSYASDHAPVVVTFKV